MTQSALANVLEAAKKSIEVIYNSSGAGPARPVAGRATYIVALLLGSNGRASPPRSKAVPGLLALEDGALESGSILQWPEHHCTRRSSSMRRGLSHVDGGRCVFEDHGRGKTWSPPPMRSLVAKRPMPTSTSFTSISPHERRKGLAGYPGGEQQMLAIGRALIAQPELILLDEPRWPRPSWWRTSSPSSRASTPSAVPACCWSNRTPPWHWPWRTAATSWRTARSSSTARLSAWPATPTCASSTWAWAAAAKPKALKIKHYKRRKRWLS